MYKTITIRVDQEFIEMTKRMAKAAKRSRGAFIRDAIYWLANNPDIQKQMLDELPRYKEVIYGRFD